VEPNGGAHNDTNFPMQEELGGGYLPYMDILVTIGGGDLPSMDILVTIGGGDLPYRWR
jgi:hypothetical protein